MTVGRRLVRAPGTVALLVAMVVLSYGPVTPDLYESIGPGTEAVQPVVLGGAAFSLVVPLTARRAVPRSPSSARFVLAVAAVALLGTALRPGAGRRRMPVRARSSDGSGRSGALGHQRRRGPPLVTA